MKKPIYYVKYGTIINNFYTTDSHPNDKQNSFKKGNSKGIIKGLEDNGWLPIDTDYNLFIYLREYHTRK